MWNKISKTTSRGSIEKAPNPVGFILLPEIKILQVRIFSENSVNKKSTKFLPFHQQSATIHQGLDIAYFQSFWISQYLEDWKRVNWAMQSVWGKKFRRKEKTNIGEIHCLSKKWSPFFTSLKSYFNVASQLQGRMPCMGRLPIWSIGNWVIVVGTSVLFTSWDKIPPYATSWEKKPWLIYFKRF